MSFKIDIRPEGTGDGTVSYVVVVTLNGVAQPARHFGSAQDAERFKQEETHRLLKNKKHD